ncbi:MULTISPECIES: acyltransferase [unclassified Rhizobium]|uniref:acyltransferase n=1 Tax=Rhizobium sp. PP-CC-3G-465 TaxID=2135648 RepID=UPI00104A4D87
MLNDFSGNVVINGTGNRVSLQRPSSCTDVYIEVSGGGTVEIGARARLCGQHIRLFAPGRITFGEGCAFNGLSYFHMHESATIRLGNDCLIAGNASFSTSHVHKIMDLDTGERLNPAGDIIVGDHVWISADASLWPGAVIGNDSVVGKGSYVSKEFPANCIIVGAPARVVRERITWEG